MLCVVMLPGIYQANAQLAAGTEGITVKSGTIFIAEDLVLQPSANLALYNLLVRKTFISTTVGDGKSILKVIFLNRTLNFSGNLGIFYQTSLLNGNTPSSLVLYFKNQFGDNTYQTLPGGSSNVPAMYVSQNFDNLKFTHITAANGLATLPVGLTDFTASAENNRTKISWKTTWESNSSYYLVERSADGHLFLPLGRLNAKGNFNGNSSYILYDEAPLNGNNYYRLIQFDTDGKAHDHGIRQVSFKISAAVSAVVFPNPVAGNTINVKLNNYTGKTVTFTMIDILGKTFYRKRFETKENTGIYDLELGFKPAAASYILHIKGEALDERVKVLVL